jgi:outer membrane receptor protein involved in Fe transport
MILKRCNNYYLKNKTTNMPLLKYIVYLVLLTCTINKLQAQNKGSISGTLIQNATPVEFATINLYAANNITVSIKNVLSDSAGNFIINNINEGNYILTIHNIGYTTVKKTIEIITLQPNTTDLKTVVITTQKNILQKTTNGFIVNAAANITQIGGTATDILRNTPTINVDEDGAITIRGKAPLILINGRNSTITNPNQIPASSIESIEIINNPSAQYDANTEGGIVNIKLKKNKQNGLHGAAALGIGVGAKGRINSSFLASVKISKWNFSLAYDNRFANRIRNINANRTSFDIPEKYFLTQYRNDNRTDKLQSIRLNIAYNINSKNSVEFEAIGEKTGQDNDEDLLNTTSSKTNVFYSKNSRRSIEIEKEKVAELALNYERKFTNKQILLTSSISSSFNYSTQNTGITSQLFNQNNALLGLAQLQQTNNIENGNVTNIKIDFAHPINNTQNIELGYKSIIRHLDADFKSLDEQNGQYIINYLVSSAYLFNEAVHAVYVQLNGFNGKKENPTFKYDIGLRAEQVNNTGKVYNTNTVFKNQYLKLFPSANIVYYTKHQAFYKLSYGRKINRPGFGQLNPFIDVTDSLNQHGGNPTLQPELINSVEFGFNKDWQKISVYSVLYYRNATNSIRQFTTLQPNGIALALPQNFGTVETYGIENIITAKPFIHYDVNFSIAVYQQNIKGNAVGQAIANNVLSFNTKLINNIVIGKGGKLQITGIYNSPIALPQGKRMETYTADIGFQQKFGKGNSRIGIAITDVFNTLQYGNILSGDNFKYDRIGKVDSRAVLVTFAYTFGTSFKEKLLDNKFSND